MLQFTVERVGTDFPETWIVCVMDEGMTPYYIRHTGAYPTQRQVEVAWFMFRSRWTTEKPQTEAA